MGKRVSKPATFFYIFTENMVDDYDGSEIVRIKIGITSDPSQRKQQHNTLWPKGEYLHVWFLYPDARPLEAEMKLFLKNHGCHVNNEIFDIPAALINFFVGFSTDDMQHIEDTFKDLDKVADRNEIEGGADAETVIRMSKENPLLSLIFSR